MNSDDNEDELQVLLTKKQFDELCEKVQTLQNQLSQLKKSQIALRSSNKTFVKDVLRLSKKVISLHTQNQTLKDRNQYLQNFIKQLKQKNNQHQITIRAVKSELQTLANEKKQALQKNQELILSENSMKSKIQYLENEIKKYQSSQQQNLKLMQKLKKENKQYQVNNCSLQQQLKQIQKQLKSCQRENQSLIKNINNQLKNSSQRYELFQDEFQCLKAFIDGIIKQILKLSSGQVLSGNFCKKKLNNMTNDIEIKEIEQNLNSYMKLGNNDLIRNFEGKFITIIQNLKKQRKKFILLSSQKSKLKSNHIQLKNQHAKVVNDNSELHKNFTNVSQQLLQTQEMYLNRQIDLKKKISMTQRELKSNQKMLNELLNQLQVTKIKLAQKERENKQIQDQNKKAILHLKQLNLVLEQQNKDLNDYVEKSAVTIQRFKRIISEKQLIIKNQQTGH